VEVDGATGRLGEDGGSPLLETEEESFTHAELDSCSLHRYRVRANSAAGRSEWSEEVAMTSAENVQQKRLRELVTGSGLRYEPIAAVEILAALSNQQATSLKHSYAKVYKEQLFNGLRRFASAGTRAVYQQLLQGRRAPPVTGEGGVDKAAAFGDAEELRRGTAEAGPEGVHFEQVARLVVRSSELYLWHVCAAYIARYGRSVEEDLRDFVLDTQFVEAVCFLLPAEVPGLRSDEKRHLEAVRNADFRSVSGQVSVARLLATLPNEAIRSLQSTYQKRYGHSLGSRVLSQTSGCATMVLTMLLAAQFKEDVFIADPDPLPGDPPGKWALDEPLTWRDSDALRRTVADGDYKGICDVLLRRSPRHLSLVAEHFIEATGRSVAEQLEGALAHGEASSAFAAACAERLLAAQADGASLPEQHRLYSRVLRLEQALQPRSERDPAGHGAAAEAVRLLARQPVEYRQALAECYRLRADGPSSAAADDCLARACSREAQGPVHSDGHLMASPLWALAAALARSRSASAVSAAEPGAGAAAQQARAAAARQSRCEAQVKTAVHSVSNLCCSSCSQSLAQLIAEADAALLHSALAASADLGLALCDDGRAGGGGGLAAALARSPAQVDAAVRHYVKVYGRSPYEDCDDAASRDGSGVSASLVRGVLPLLPGRERTLRYLGGASGDSLQRNSGIDVITLYFDLKNAADGALGDNTRREMLAVLGRRSQLELDEIQRLFALRYGVPLAGWVEHGADGGAGAGGGGGGESAEFDAWQAENAPKLKGPVAIEESVFDEASQEWLPNPEHAALLASRPPSRAERRRLADPALREVMVRLLDPSRPRVTGARGDATAELAKEDAAKLSGVMHSRHFTPEELGFMTAVTCVPPQLLSCATCHAQSAPQTTDLLTTISGVSARSRRSKPCAAPSPSATASCRVRSCCPRRSSRCRTPPTRARARRTTCRRWRTRTTRARRSSRRRRRCWRRRRARWRRWPPTRRRSGWRCRRPRTRRRTRRRRG